MSVLHQATYTRSQKESNDRHRRWYAPPPKATPEKRADPPKKVPPKRDILIVSTAALAATTAIDRNTTGRAAHANAPPMEKIIEAICIVSNTQRRHLVSERKTRHLARTRQIAFYIARHATTLSCPQIGRKFSDRDHTTVLHGVKRIELLRSGDVEETLQATVKMLRSTGFVVDIPQIEQAAQ